MSIVLSELEFKNLVKTLTTYADHYAKLKFDAIKNCVPICVCDNTTESIKTVYPAHLTAILEDIERHEAKTLASVAESYGIKVKMEELE